MKAMNIRIISIFLLAILLSCSGNKQSQLAKLKEQRQNIDEQIKKLEAEVANSNGKTLNPDKLKFIGITEVKTSPFDHYVRVQGSLDGDQNAEVFAEAPGTVSAKYADVGQQVAKGQVLAQIDDREYRSQLESAETNYKFAADMFEKQKRLWDQKIGSEVQYLQAKTSKESLEQQITSLKQQIEKFKIKSPISGTIEECNIKVGGVVSPNPQLVAYRVVAFSNLKVIAEVSEAYSSRVQKGDKLIVQFPDINKEFIAKVDFVSKYINPVNRTFLIESKITNGIQDLKANMVAIIRINDYHTDNAITVPMNVIQTDQTGSYVYVIRPKGNYNAATKHPVTIGGSYNGVAEILSGLTKGDKVISTGYQELIDGEYVRF
ncbi:MAG: efflux RND transporter periplasmic adaptor subunit [Bacteroidales bacterium]|nr:MAG: efflux RND transporter periplasmic adaptor subunit [Bacteroidales bacterium]